MGYNERYETPDFAARAGIAGRPLAGYDSTDYDQKCGLQPQVFLALDSLDGATSHLIEAVSMLGTRLCSVLRPEGPENACAEPKSAERVPLAARLDETTNEIHRLAGRLDSYLARLEL